MENKHNRCLIIPRGLHFSSDLFPEIVIPHDHVAPYRNPQTGLEAPLFTVGLFASTDMLFPGTPGDLDLFTNEEVYALARIGSLKSPITGAPNVDVPTPTSRMEPDPSTRKQIHQDSLRHRHPVYSAAGSLEDLDKSEYEHAAEFNRITRDRCSVALKCGISIDRGFSSERPCPKERRAERGRSRERKRPISPKRPHPPSLLFTPMVPSHPTTGSHKGPLPLERGGDTDAPMSSIGPVAPSSWLQLVHSSGQVANIQVSSGLVPSGLTAEQSDEIFLLSREVQTLHRKLALDFIGLSHQEA